MQKMAYKLKTKLGRMLYALRKQTVEPLFGIIKSVMGFRQFFPKKMAFESITLATSNWLCTVSTTARENTSASKHHMRFL